MASAPLPSAGIWTAPDEAPADAERRDPLRSEGGRAFVMVCAWGDPEQPADRRCKRASGIEDTDRYAYQAEAAHVESPCLGVTGKARMRDLGPEYARLDDDAFTPRYRARCYCGTVCYEVCADPLDAKICPCRTCHAFRFGRQKLHEDVKCPFAP
jgi:hypothetical protein